MDKDPLWKNRVSNTSEGDIGAAFSVKGPKASLMGGSPLAALQKARKSFSAEKQDQSLRVIHFVSDFRDKDWGVSGPQADKMREEIKGILADGINLNLVDVAAPFRGTTGKALRHSPNLGLQRLRPRHDVPGADPECE